MTATAPVAPEIMPGRPPKIAVIRPIRKAAYRPIVGSTWATKEKAMASGIRASATVSPERMSFLMFAGFFSIKSNIMGFYRMKLGIISFYLGFGEFVFWLGFGLSVV